MTITEAKDKIEEAAQHAFDQHCKPLIVAEMRRLKIKKINYVMGVYFFTMNNGRQLSDTDFEESTSTRKKFVDEYVYPFSDRIRAVNNDIEL